MTQHFGYRVRHPMAPDLFVWYVGTPTVSGSTALGILAQRTIYFASVRAPMTKDGAEEMAALCGGTVEEVILPGRADDNHHAPGD